MRGLHLLSVMGMRGNGAAGRAQGFPVSDRCAIARARLRRHAQRGVSALEFALVAPAALLVLFFSIEIGIMMMADATLTRVTGQIAREMQVYKGPAGGNGCTAKIRQQLAEGMKPWVRDDKNLKIASVAYAPDGEPTGSDDAAILCDTGGRGALILYTVGFEQPSFTGILGTLGIRLLKFERSFLIQNEP